MKELRTTVAELTAKLELATAKLEQQAARIAASSNFSWARSPPTSTTNRSQQREAGRVPIGLGSAAACIGAIRSALIVGLRSVA